MWVYPALAFVVAALISSVELITANYPRTYFLVLRKSRALFYYALIYGLLAFIITLAADYLVAAGKLKLEGMIVGAKWFRAVAIGIAVKSLLHINLFNITTGSQTLPIGIETITKIFEPPLIRRIIFDEFDAVRTFLAPYIAKYSNLTDVKALIAANVPPTLPPQESQAFETELNKAANVTQAMERGLRFLGRQTFVRIFPP